MNHLLLDSHVLLWVVEPGAKRLPARAKTLITDAESVHFSIASFWEIAIKAAKGQLDIDLDVLSAAVDQAALQELPVKRQHIKNDAYVRLSSPRSVRQDAGRSSRFRASSPSHQ